MPLLNVLGQPLKICCADPPTGYFRDGLCRTDERDLGRHTVCAQMTSQFLAFTQSQGNDLITPRPEWGFAGLQPGDHWCLCVLRWKQALDANLAPPVLLARCSESALQYVTLAQLQANAV